MSQDEIDRFNAQQQEIKKEDILMEMFGCTDPKQIEEFHGKLKNLDKLKSEREYLTDDRSGQEIDSDTEFTEIMELNNLLNEFRDNIFDELEVQNKILKIFK